MGKKGISIRRSLLRNLVLLILLTSGAILAVTVVAGKHAVEDLSRTLIEKAAEQTEKELEHFFGSVHGQVLIGREWAKSDMLDADHPLALNALFVPILEQNRQLSSMMVSESTGTGYLLLRDALNPHQWVNRVIHIKEGGNEAYKRYWNTQTGAVREETIPMNYDSRTRLWYKGSMKTVHGTKGKEVFWTKPVIFLTTKDPGITAGTHYTHPDGRSVVVAYDLLLLDIARLTTKRIRPSKNGTAFVLVEDKEKNELRVVGLPKDVRFSNDNEIKKELIVVPQTVADAAAHLPRADDFGIGPIAFAVKAWKESGMEGKGATFSFEGANGDWWAGMRPFDVGQNRFWIGVAVPERDFLGEVERQQEIVLGIALLALFAAIIMAIFLARGYGKPLEQLVLTSQRIRSLDLHLDSPVNSRLREINDLAHSQRELISAMQSFVRYVPLEVVRELVKRGAVAQIGGKTESLTILFTDVRGFTSISEKMTPQELAEHMAEYFEMMLGEIRMHGATVDKMVGDAIIAFWGAPKPDENHAEHALTSTLACRERLAEKNAEWEARGLPPMPTRFGIATGDVVVGNIGAATRLNYTVLGDTVNLAARLEGINKLYGTEILVSESVKDSVSEGFAWRRVDQVAVKGKSKAVNIYELLGREGQLPQGDARFAKKYEEALELFQEKEFNTAKSVALHLRSLRSDDASVLRLIACCEDFLENPPPEDWDGATRLNKK